MKGRLPAYLEAALFILLTATVAWRIAVDRSGADNMDIEAPAESAAELLKQADEAYESKDLEGAAALYRDVLKRDPDNPRAPAQLARIAQSAAKLLKQADEAYESMDMAGAAALYYDVLKRDPDNRRSRIQLARVFLLNNWNANSIQLLDEVLERDPDHLEARLIFAKILRDEGKSKVAALVYESALRVNPDNPEALYYLGTAYQADGKFTEALSSYRRAIALDEELKTPPLEEAPFGVQAYLQIGRTYRQLARYHRRQAADAERNGNAEDAAYARMLSKRRGDRALKELRDAHEKALSADLEEYDAVMRELTSALAERALDMRRNREPEMDILRVYQEITQIDPEDIDAWIEAGRILTLNAKTLSDYEEARRHFAAAYELSPTDRDARVGMTDAQQEIDRLKGDANPAEE